MDQRDNEGDENLTSALQIQASGMGDTRTMLSTLWIFAMFNYLYADVIALFDKTVVIRLAPESLFGAAILMETPIAMVLLSRVLQYRTNRWANIIVGTINTSAVILSLEVGTPSLYSVFFVTIEAACTALIVWYAWTWSNPGGPA
jgi:hypothetical protein